MMYFALFRIALSRPIYQKHYLLTQAVLITRYVIVGRNWRQICDIYLSDRLCNCPVETLLRTKPYRLQENRILSSR